MSRSNHKTKSLRHTDVYRPLAGLALLIGTFASSFATAQQNLQPGIVLPRVASVQHPEQTYALYLPSNYTPNKRWPIVYAFDPAARGRLTVDLMKDAVEHYGYIVAGSNNSRSGSWKMEDEAAQVMLQDTRARLSIDDRRIYFAGFSGGARLSAGLAQRCGFAAGVIVSGAGFQLGAQKTNDTFAVFAAVGSYDFNYGEIVALDESLQKLNAPHFLRRFDGPHQWQPANVFEEALAWIHASSGPCSCNRQPGVKSNTL